MKVKDIVTLALDFCHEDELASSLRASQTTLTDDENAKVDLFVRCFNLVYNEIASQYVPIIKNQKVSTDEGKVLFSSLQGKVLDVVMVKDSKGRKIKFRKFNDYLFALAGQVEVFYKTEPDALLISSEFSCPLPERVFAYGIAREYFFLNGLQEDGEIYDTRFKDSLLVLLGKNKEIIIPARGWI